MRTACRPACTASHKPGSTFRAWNMHDGRGFRLRPSTVFRLLCSVCVILGDANAPPPFDSWIGTYTGDCALQIEQAQGDNLQCAPDLQHAPFVYTVSWDDNSNRLLLYQNVTWTTSTNSTSQSNTLPPQFIRQNVTITDQAIEFDKTGYTPVCVDVANMYPPVRFGVVVFNTDVNTRVYLEEGTFMANNPIIGNPRPSWYCPLSMNSVETKFVCNITVYNYRCQGYSVAPLQPPSPPPPAPQPPSPPFPFPTPPPFPLPTPPPPLPAHLSSPPSAGMLATQPSPASSSHKTTVLAAAIGGAAAFILVAAGIGFMMHKKGCPLMASKDPPAGDGKDADRAKDVAVLFPNTLPAPIQGLVDGDPFLRTTAPLYSWVVEDPDTALYVQSGITDTYLDSMATDGQPGPCVQLTSAQVRQEIELLTSGLLGRGGAALVFMCRWRKRFGDGLLAIKLLKDAFDTPISVLQSFEYEGRLLSAIRHPHVVQLYGWCMDLPHVCLIMELLPGSLEAHLYRTAPGASKPATGTWSLTGQSHTSQRHSGSPATGNTHSSNNSSAFASALGTRYGTGRSNLTPAKPELSVSPVATSPDVSRGITSGGMSHSSGQTPTSPTTPATSAPLSSISHSTQTGGPPQRLSMQAVLQVAADVAAALAYLHDRQITGLPEWATELEAAGAHQDGAARAAKVVHRDLKPANVLINSDGRAKLSDFGLARENSSTTVHTMHINAGTLAYMAPELLSLSPTKPTNRVDIYSLGIMMWELVEHRKPWQDINQAQIVNAVVSGKRPRIQESTLFSAGSSMHSPPLSPSSPQQEHTSSSSVKLSTSTVDWSQVPADFSACPKLADLVRDCWHQREYKRPSAAEVLRQLQALMAPIQQEGTKQ